MQSAVWVGRKYTINCHPVLSMFLPDVTTYYKKCDSCWMMYRYQESADGLHNFDDRHVFTISLMLFMREFMKVGSFLLCIHMHTYLNL